MSRRNWLFRILQALVIVAVASSLALAQDFVYLKKKAAAAAGGGGCSTESYVTGSARASEAGSSATVSDTGFVLSSGAQRKVVVMVSQEDGGNNNYKCTGITFNGVAMTRLAPAADDLAVDGTRRFMSVWYIDEADLPAAGTYTITATFSGAVLATGMIAMELDGAATGAAAHSGTAIAANLTGTAEITTAVANSKVLVFGFNSITSSATQEASDYTPTELIDATYQTGQATQVASQGTVAAASTVTAGMTWASGVTNGMIAVAISPYCP